MITWLVLTEGDKQPIQLITAFTSAKHAKILAASYTRYMPKREDIAVVVPTAAERPDVTVHEEIAHVSVTDLISTPVLERKLAEELDRQGETLLIEHLEEVLHDRKAVQR